MSIVLSLVRSCLDSHVAETMDVASDILGDTVSRQTPCSSGSYHDLICSTSLPGYSCLQIIEQPAALPEKHRARTLRTDLQPSEVDHLGNVQIHHSFKKKKAKLEDFPVSQKQRSRKAFFLGHVTDADSTGSKVADSKAAEVGNCKQCPVGLVWKAKGS